MATGPTESHWFPAQRMARLSVAGRRVYWQQGTTVAEGGEYSTDSCYSCDKQQRLLYGQGDLVPPRRPEKPIPRQHYSTTIRFIFSNPYTTERPRGGTEKHSGSSSKRTFIIPYKHNVS